MAFLWGWTLQLSTQEYLGIGLQRSWNWITPAQCMCWCYMPKKFCITQVWIEFFSSLSLSWLLQLFFSRNVSWKRIFGPTNLVQHTFYWKLLKKYAKYRSGFFEIFFINMKSYNIHQDPKHLQLCKISLFNNCTITIPLSSEAFIQNSITRDIFARVFLCCLEVSKCFGSKK